MKCAASCQGGTSPLGFEWARGITAKGSELQVEAVATGAMMIVGGACGFVWAPRVAPRYGSASVFYGRAWLLILAAFGALPVVSILGLPARVQDAVSSVVISIGLAAGVWFLVQGVRTRRAEFREQQRDCRNRGAVPPRYFWSPWAIFGWTAALGGLVVVVGGMAVASAIAAMLGFQTQEEVNRASQTAASAITAGIFALVPVAAALGLWRWWRLRSEPSELLVSVS